MDWQVHGFSPGGYVGLRVYNSARYTIDLDSLLVKADVATTMKQTATAIESDIDDGTWFVLESHVDLKTRGEYRNWDESSFRRLWTKDPNQLAQAFKLESVDSCRLLILDEIHKSKS